MTTPTRDLLAENADPHKAFGAKCRECGHVWIIGYLPMPMRQMGKLSGKAKCPKCGDKKPLLAKTAEIAAVMGLAPPVAAGEG